MTRQTNRCPGRARSIATRGSTGDRGEFAGGRPGFTMIELMVALSTGLLVTFAVFFLSKVALDGFQQDARVNSAQYSAMMGMNQILADIKRAGYMASPDSDNDPLRCGPRLPVEHARRLIGINVLDGANAATYAGAESLPAVVTGPENNRQPDRVRIAGNFLTNEVFEYRAISGNQVFLDIDQNSIQRVFRDSLEGGPAICDLFPADRYMRFLDAGGMETYVRITACNATPSANYLTSVVIDFATLGGALPATAACGAANGRGLANPVNVMEYLVQHVGPPFPANAGALGLDQSIAAILDYDPATVASTGEDTRLELVRREISAVGVVNAPVANSGSIAAELVADFKLNLYSTPTPGGTTVVPNNFVNPAAIPPQRIRSVGVRLTTRSRAADRDNSLFADTGVAPPAGAPLDRFRAFPVASPVRTANARARTMYSETLLNNLPGISS